MKAFKLILIAAAAVATSQAIADPIGPYPNAGDCLRKNDGSVICIRNTVVSITNNDNIGNVVGLFNNGMARVSMIAGNYTGQTLEYSIDVLSRSVQCARDICVRTEVISRTNDDNTGQVVMVFENGISRVLMRSGNYTGQTLSYAAGTVAPQVQCSGGICAGSQVISRTNPDNSGRVVMVYGNGKARVQMMSGNYRGQVLTYDVANLAAGIGAGPQPPVVVPGPPVIVPAPGPGPGPGAWRCENATNAGIFHGAGVTENEGVRNSQRACMNAGHDPYTCMHGRVSCRRF
jgi:hypothetical protein